jgi:pimeloyl-ACP methyl ester carboxylesterase
MPATNGTVAVSYPSMMNRRATPVLLAGLGWLLASSRVAVAQEATGPGSERRAFTLPDPSGPHPVGTVALAWIDHSRPDSLSGSSGKTGAGREIVAQIWYPAERPPGSAGDRSTDAGTGAAPYMPDGDALVAGLRAMNFDFASYMADAVADYRRVRAHALPDAPMRHASEPFPVVLFSPGGSMSRHFHTVQMEDLASHGFVAVGISHLASGLDWFPRTGASISHKRWEERGVGEAEAARRDEELSNMLAADARFVLDRLTELNESDPEGRLTDRLQVRRVAILGHSRGGSTVGRACSTDSRFVACIVLDNIGPEPERATGLAQPMLEIRQPWPEDRVGRLHGYLANTGSVAIDVIIDGAGHFNFSDLGLIDPERYGSDADAERVLRITNDVTRAFLERYLVGVEADPIAVARSYPGVTVERFVAGQAWSH